MGVRRSGAWAFVGPAHLRLGGDDVSRRRGSVLQREGGLEIRTRAGVGSLEIALDVGATLVPTGRPLPADDETVRLRLVTVHVQHQIHRSRGVHRRARVENLRGRLRGRLPPLAVEIGAGRVCSEMASDGAVGVHVRHHVHRRAAQHLLRHGILAIEKTRDETFHPPRCHGFAGVLPADDPDDALRASVAFPGGEFRSDRLHRRRVLRRVPRELHLGGPRAGSAEAQAIERAAVEGEAEDVVRHVRRGGGSSDEVEVLLVVVGHEIREVDAVGGDGVEVDDEGAVLVRRRGNAVPIDAVGGAERLVVVPPVGVGGVARVGDDDLQRGSARAGDAEVEPLEVRAPVLVREGLLAHAHGEHGGGGGDELAVAAVERAAEVVVHPLGRTRAEGRGGSGGGGGHGARNGPDARRAGERRGGKSSATRGRRDDAQKDSGRAACQHGTSPRK